MRTISYVTEFYQRIGSCVVVVVLRAVDTRRRLHPYNDHTLWRLGGAGDAVGIPRNCCSASRPDIRHGCRPKTPSTSNKNCIPLGNKTRTKTIKNHWPAHAKRARIYSYIHKGHIYLPTPQASHTARRSSAAQNSSRFASKRLRATSSPAKSASRTVSP